MSYSPTDKPTVPQLCTELSSVVEWQEFAILLPGIETKHIETIERERHGITRQKVALFTKWLQVNPGATWSNVYDALVNMDMMSLACSLVKARIPNQSPSDTGTQSGSSPVSLTPPVKRKQFKHEIPIEDSIGNTLLELYKIFMQIIYQVKTEFATFVSQQPAQLQNIIRFTEDAISPSQLVRLDASNVDEYFHQLHPYYDFLECEVITSIVKQFIGGKLEEKLREYSAKAREFRRTAPIKRLANDLREIADFKVLPTIEAKLETPWEGVMIEGLRVLIKHLLPKTAQSQYSLMNNIVISPGCLLLKYGIRDDGQIDTIIQHVQHKTQFMRLIGVLRLSVADKPVILEDEDPSFSFARSLLDATKTNNKAAVQFLRDISPYINCQGDTKWAVYYTGTCILM